MPESAIIKFVLEDDTQQRGAPAAPMPAYQPPAQPAIPGYRPMRTEVSYEEGMRLLQEEARESAIPHGYTARRRRVLRARRLAHRRRRGRVEREAEQAAARARRPPPPPVRPPPIIGPEEAEVVPGVMERFLAGSGRSAIPSFVSGAVGRFTGSGTLGGLAGTAAGGAQSALAGLGAAGVATAGALTGVALVGMTVIEVFKRLYDRTDELVRSVAAYSPHVARATAMAEVTEIQTQLRRARELGPELGQYVTAKAGLRSEWAEVTDALMQQVIPPLTEVLKVAADAAKVAKLVVEWDPTIKAYGLLFDVFMKWDPQIRVLRDLARLAEKLDKKTAMDEEIRLTMEMEEFWTQPGRALKGTPDAEALAF